MDTNTTFSDFQTYATYRSLSSSSGFGNKKSRNRQSSSSQRNSRNDSKSGKSGYQNRKTRGGSSQTVKRQLEFQDDHDDESNVPMLFRSYITPLSECNLRVVYDDEDEEDSVPRILSNPRKVTEKSTTKATTSKSSSKSSTKSSSKSSSNHRFKKQKLTLLSASPPSTPLTSRSATRVTFTDDNDDDESRKALEELIPSTPEFIPESELDTVVSESPKPSTSNHDHHESPRIVLEKVATSSPEPHRIAAESTTQSNYRIDTSESEEYSVDADDDRRRRDYRNVDYANSPNAGYYVRKLLCVEESSDSGLDAVDRVDPFPMRRQEPKVVKKKSKVKKSRRERNNQRPQPQPPPNEPTTSKPSGSRVQTSIPPPEPEHSGDSDHYVVDDQYTQLQNQQQNPPPPPCPLSKSVINRRQVDRILTKLSRYAQLFGPRGSDNEEDDPTPEAIRLTLHLVEHMKKMNILFLNKDCQWLRDTSTGMMFERYLRLQVDARFVDLNSKTKLQLVCTVLPGSNYGPNGPFEFDGPLMQNRVKKGLEVCVHPSCPYSKLSKSPLKSSTSEPTESVPDEEPESNDVSYAKKNDILPVGYSVLLMYNKGFSIPKESFIGGSTKVRIFPDWKLQHLRKGVRLCCQKYYYVMLNACNLLIE